MTPCTRSPVFLGEKCLLPRVPQPRSAPAPAPGLFKRLAAPPEHPLDGAQLRQSKCFQSNRFLPWPPHLTSKPTHLVLWKGIPSFCPISTLLLSTITVLTLAGGHTGCRALPARRGV